LMRQRGSTNFYHRQNLQNDLVWIIRSNNSTEQGLLS